MIAAGQHLGGYTVQRRIGGGQMGEVFLAQHRRIARRAAIKALIPELSAKEAVIERFFKQARNTSLVTHPGIVEVLDCDVHEGQAYVVMEFLQGESLGTYLKRNGNLQGDLAFLLGVIAQVAGAVGAAHDAGIMHRGLKPENIFLHLGPPPGTAVAIKVLDFGVAQLSRDDGGPSRTTRGVLLGSPAYFSPEQCRGTGRTDERSDIYSLGCVFYEALCGRTPFVSRSAAELITAQVTEAPKAPSKLVPDVPPKLNALIVKMLAKSPEERPRGMGEVVESLRACARAMGIDFEGALEPVVPVERPDYLQAPVAPASPGASAPPAPAREPAMPAPAVMAPAVPLPPAIEAPAPRHGAVPSWASARPPVAAALPTEEPAPPAEVANPPAPEAAPVSPARAPEVARKPAVPLAELMAAAARSAPGELPFPQRSPAQLPRTKILEDEPPAPAAAPVTTAPPRRSAPDPVDRLNALAGETIAIPSSRGVPSGSSHAASPSTPAGLAGGTQLLPPERSPKRWADPEDRSGVGAAPDERRAAPRPVPVAAAQTERLGVVARAADFWHQRPWLVIGLTAAGVVLCVALAATLPFGRGSSPPPVLSPAPSSPAEPRPAAEADPRVGPGAPGARPNEMAAPSPPAPSSSSSSSSPPAAPGAAGPARSAPADGANVVHIEFRGIPAGTKVTLDGRPAPLPVAVPRGSGTHRLTLRTPDGLEQAVEVDGTKDRVIDWYIPGAAAEPAPRKAPPPPKSVAPAGAPSTTNSTKPRPKDVEA
ncbi:MAG TPA: protein kinase, partial [Polyangia bacterium]